MRRLRVGEEAVVMVGDRQRGTVELNQRGKFLVWNRPGSGAKESYSRRSTLEDIREHVARLHRVPVAAVSIRLPATRRDVVRRVRELGATMTSDRIGDSVQTEIEAPRGYIFARADLHCLVDHVYRPWQPDWQDLLDRMEYGTEPCPHGPGCEWCHPEEESSDD